MAVYFGFRCPRGLKESDEEELVPLAKDVDWFTEKLARIPGVRLESVARQEDWGVSVLLKQDEFLFQVGLGYFPGDEQDWLGQLTHGPAGLLQRFSGRGKEALRLLARAVHTTLCSDHDITNLKWCEQDTIPTEESEWRDSPDDGQAG